MAAPLSPKEVAVRWFHEVWNNRKREVVPELMAASAKGHLEGGEEIIGPGQFLHFHKLILQALPDIRMEILRTVGDGEYACILWNATATHAGPGFGLVPTDRKISFRGTTWLHVIDGKIIEGWDCWNQGALLSSLAAP